jgi:hypothetical protein
MLFIASSSLMSGNYILIRFIFVTMPHLFFRPDQWNYYKKYLTSAIQLVKDAWAPSEKSEDDVDYTFEKVAAFLQEDHQKEAEEGKAPKPLRSAQMAQLEFTKLITEGNHEHPEDFWGLGESLCDVADGLIPLSPFSFISQAQ